jgi:endonuclease YncB( thermonuclease family)
MDEERGEVSEAMNSSPLRMLLLAVLCFVPLAARPQAEGTFIGRVVRVTDGDTVTLEVNNRRVKIYQCVIRHSDELLASGKVRRPVEAQVLERFRDCGDLHKGLTYRRY